MQSPACTLHFTDVFDEFQYFQDGDLIIGGVFTVRSKENDLPEEKIYRYVTYLIWREKSDQGDKEQQIRFYKMIVRNTCDGNIIRMYILDIKCLFIYMQAKLKVSGGGLQ